MPPAARAFDPVSASEEITAVSSKVSNGYTRTRLADGSFRPERYGFGIGGFLNNSMPGLENSEAVATRDPTIDDESFGAISRAIRGPLAAQQYLPTGDPASADLLIVVYWGRTIGSGAFSQAGLSAIQYGPDQDRIDSRNAALLGFNSEGVFGAGFGSSISSSILRQLHSDVVSAVKADRYYVILRAYDFPSAWKKGKLRLLWETRFSLSQRGHEFGRDLPRMAQAASRYFGQDSQGLVQKPVPVGQVDIGEVKSLGEVPAK